MRYVEKTRYRDVLKRVDIPSVLLLNKHMKEVNTLRNTYQIMYNPPTKFDCILRRIACKKKHPCCS